MMLSLTFFPLCAVVAFVCTAVKDTDRDQSALGSRFAIRARQIATAEPGEDAS